MPLCRGSYEAADVRRSARSNRWICGLGAALLLAAGAGCTKGRAAFPSEGPAPAEAQAVRFVDVTAAAGLNGFVHQTGAFGQKWFPETMGAGCAFFDYDGDGWEDVLLVGGGSWPQQGQPPVQAVRLYRNRGDGTFEEKTRAAGLEGVSAYAFGLAAADYDNDGDQDVFLTTLHENLLFRNDGGTFTEVGRAAGLQNHRVWSTSALFFDADRDGWPDLYVGNYVKWTPETDAWCMVDGTEKAYCTPSVYEGEPSHFYRNNGDGTFTDQTGAAGFGGAPGNTLGVAELDVNGDGRPDLAVANDLQRNLLYLNDGDGTFTERGLLAGVAFDQNGRARGGMGIDAGVVDTTGRVTIFVGNFAREMTAVFRDTGGGLFVDRGARSNIGRASLPLVTFGLFLFDADLDGDQDLLAANGHIRDNVEKQQDGSLYRQPVQLFLNRNDGQFELVQAGLETPLVGRGAAYADYDRDGDLDVLITENGGPVRLYRNELADPAFLRVRLTGTTGGRDALGARVVAHAGGRRLERRVRTGSSYLSQSEKTVTFGLGAATGVDSLVVHWPGGRVDRFGAIEANREIELVEGSGRIAVASGAKAARTGGAAPAP